MLKSKWLDLQLFGGEGAGNGGDGANSGGGDATSSVDAEQQALLDLGVPKDKIRTRSKAKTPHVPADEQKQVDNVPQQVDAANANPTEEKTDKPKYVWDDIKNDPDINREIQKIVQSRLKSVKRSEDTLAKVTPMLEVLARKYGQDPANIDFDKLNESVNNDNDYYESRALELGVPVEVAKKIDREERDSQRKARIENQTLERQAIESHLNSLRQQGEALKAIFPNFNLDEELKNPVFFRMTAPGKGVISVEDAYRAVHRKEIDAAASQVIARKTAEQISASIQANGRRPRENGTSAQAPSVTTFDYANASREQREKLKARIRSGERIVPGREFK